jgi:hypothetical protein
MPHLCRKACVEQIHHRVCIYIPYQYQQIRILPHGLPHNSARLQDKLVGAESRISEEDELVFVGCVERVGGVFADGEV